MLSLGATNLVGYSFTANGSTLTTSSTGKVQMVIKATATDQVNLSALLGDELGSNTGTLEGGWNAKGSVTLGGVNYKIFDHSTTQAQVLVNIEPTRLLSTIGFTSMTKDSGTVANADWLTADGSAGRLVSGFLDTPLATGDVVKVYSNGTLLGNAVVDGTQWTITDPNAYTGNWTYGASIVDSTGAAGPMATQSVSTDFVEVAPVITGVVNTDGQSIAHQAYSGYALGSISGTGTAGATVYVYESNGNAVGSAVVSSTGSWTVTSPTASAMANTFAARQIDAQGNESVNSNLWSVSSTGTNLLTNGDLSAGATGFTTTTTGTSAMLLVANASADPAGTIWTRMDQPYTVNSTYLDFDKPTTTSLAKTGTVAAATGMGAIAWATDYGVLDKKSTTDLLNPDGTMSGNVLFGGVHETVDSTVWSSNVTLVANKTYKFTFDYWDDYARLGVGIGTQTFKFSSNPYTTTAAFDYQETGHFEATFTPTVSGAVTFKLTAYGRRTSGGPDGNFALDNFKVAEVVTPGNGVLVAGATTTTSGVDTVSYTNGTLSTLDGNDVITASSNQLPSALTAGGYIHGGAGVDTLKLAAGTTLDLTALTNTQTVQEIQQIEVFEMVGNSSLSLSANSVLSLGGTNLAGFNFTNTLGGISTSSTGKVQMVIKATSTDSVNLSGLKDDGLGSNSGALEGGWNAKGSVTIGGVNYKVYDHSTTQAQVLVDADVNAAREGNQVTITSVKASGTTTKVITETFDSLPYTGIAMDSFTTNNGLTFKQDSQLPTFTIGADGTGVNGVGRALILNNLNLPGAVNQWSVNTPTGVTSATVNYWDLNAATSGGGQFFDAPTSAEDLATIVAMTTGGSATAPLSVTSTTTSTVRNNVGYAGQPNDKYFVDNLQYRFDGLAETTDVIDGGVTRFTTGTVTGTLTAPLLAGQYLQVFSNGVSLGNATVSGTNWSIADTIAASGEAYTAKLMNADGSVSTASMGYAVNQTVGSAPKLTISDDVSGAAATGVSVNYTFQFDQAVTGFDASDILVTNGGVKGPLIQLDAKTWVMSVNTPNTGSGVTEVAVADGSFTATTGGASGLGHSDAQAYDASLTQYVFDQYGNGSTTGNASSPITSGAGDDYITTIGKSGGGIEVINTGAGNDTLQIQASNITKLTVAPGATAASFNGGADVDTLQLFQVAGTTTALTLDLTNANVALNLKNFESIDITGTANNIVKLNLNSVLNMSDIADNPATTANEGSMLVLNGNAGDTVQLSGGVNWTTVTSGVSGASLSATYGAGYNFVAGDMYTQLSNSGATLFLDESMTRSNVA